MASFVISVIGGKGGVGKSVFAGNLAFALSMMFKQKTLLLDFDQKSCGDQRIISGIKSKKNLADLSVAGSVDPRSLSSYIGLHKMQVAHIEMPTDPLIAQQIDPEGLGKFFKALEKSFQFTVIDLGSELNPLSLKALEYTTLLFGVVTPDFLAINQTKRLHQELLTSLIPKEMIHFIVNNYSKSIFSPEVISKHLGQKVFSLIPSDPKTIESSLSKGKPVAELYPSSPFFRGVSETVHKLKEKRVLQQLSKIKKEPIKKRSGTLGDSLDTNSKKGGKEKKNWNSLKSRINRSLVEEIDLGNQKQSDDPRQALILKEKAKKVIVGLLSKEDTKGVINNRDDLNRIVKEVLDEALGLGPLEDLLADPKVTEIMVVAPDKIYFEQDGKNKLSPVTFSSDRQVLQVIERIVAPIGRRIDEKTPYVDARLADGSRVHAIIPPCALEGCTITIRKFPENRLTYKDLINFGSMNQSMADFLRLAVEARKNIVISGGTGSGKTTLINVLGSFIPNNERIITVEDSAELDLPQSHIVRLETRPPSLDGSGEISIRLLVKQTLRMKPDRILVGECRGGETLDMLQAMNTGHDGSMTTVHSNSPRDCLARLETLVQYAGAGLAPKSIREMIVSSVDLIVQQTRLEDGSRKVLNITEVSGMQGDVITSQDIFLFKHEGINKKGKVEGKFQSTGFIPSFVETLERKGYKIPRGLFTSEDE